MNRPATLLSKPSFGLLCLCLLFAKAESATDTLNNPHERIRITADSSSKKGLATLVNVDADDAYLPKILSILSEISGYNVVAGPEVNNKQRISIHLKGAPVEEAVNLVVRAAGLSYEIVGNSFLVTNQENLKNEVGIISYVVELKYAKASEVKELLKNITANIQVAFSQNALLISTSPKAISEIRKIIERIDIPSKQIMLQTRMIEVSIDDVKNLGFDWERLSHLTTIIAENPIDPLTGRGKAPTETELGTIEREQLPTKHVFQKIDGTKNIGRFSRQLSAFDITIDWLLKNNCGKLLTDAKLTAMNNRKATVLIGEIIPFTVQSQMNAQVERDSIGIKVELTPQVNADGGITLYLKPEVSNITELIENRIPRKKIRTAETTVLVKDRQKILIAGLMNEEEKTVTHKVPFLGDLLFVGKLFQHQYKEMIRSDLLIEITPYVLNNMDSAALDAMTDTLLDLRDSLEKAKARFVKNAELPRLTRLFTLPTTEVLKPFQYTVGIHEIALGQFNNFQLFFTPSGSLARLKLGVKYQYRPSLALGLGYRWGMPEGEPYYTGRQVGLFAIKELVRTSYFQWYGMLNGQAGSEMDGGFGTGLALWAGPYAALLAENSWSYRTTANDDYWTLSAGAGLHLKWPWMPGLSGTVGLQYNSDNRITGNFASLGDFNRLRLADKLYIDLSYSGLF